MQIAFETIKDRIGSGVDSETVLSTLTSVVSNASAYVDDVAWGAFQGRDARW